MLFLVPHSEIEVSPANPVGLDLRRAHVRLAKALSIAHDPISLSCHGRASCIRNSPWPSIIARRRGMDLLGVRHPWHESYQAAAGRAGHFARRAAHDDRAPNQRASALLGRAARLGRRVLHRCLTRCAPLQRFARSCNGSPWLRTWPYCRARTACQCIRPCVYSMPSRPGPSFLAVHEALQAISKGNLHLAGQSRARRRTSCARAVARPSADCSCARHEENGDGGFGHAAECAGRHQRLRT
jgi:hypothetical protein